MAAMIIRIKASSLPGLWTLSSKYLFAGSQFQASQKRCFAALGYKPLNGGPNLLAVGRLDKKCDAQLSSKSFKTKLKQLLAFKQNPELLRYQQKIGGVIKSIDRNQVKRFLIIMGPILGVLLALNYMRGDSKQQLISEVEADKESIGQKLKEEQEQTQKKPVASHVTPFRKVMKKDDNIPNDYALPSFTSAPKKKKDLIESDSLYMPHNDMQESDENGLNSKFEPPKSTQVEPNVETGKDDLLPCLEPSPCKAVQKTEDTETKGNDQMPCSMPSPCQDSKKPEKTKSHSLITSDKSPPFKGVKKSDISPSKPNYQSPYVKSQPCKDKPEVVAPIRNHQSPSVKSPSNRDVKKDEEFVPVENSHNRNIKSPTITEFPKSDVIKSEKNDNIPCSKTPPRKDLHKAKEWSLTKCSHIKTPPGIHLGVKPAVANESHDGFNVAAPCIEKNETSVNESNLTVTVNESNLTVTVNEKNVSSVNESNLTVTNNETNLTLDANESKSTDGTGQVTTLPCTETKQLDNSKGLNKPKRLIRSSSPEKPVKENHNAPGAKTPKIHFKKLQPEETVNDGANIKKNNSPQNITKPVTEPTVIDFAAENISQNNATSSDDPNGEVQAGSPEMVCTINPEEIEMDLSTNTTTNKNATHPEKDPKKNLVVNKSPIGNFMKKDCAKPEKVEKKLCLKSTFKEKDKGLEKDSTNYKRREVVEVNDKVCVDDK